MSTTSSARSPAGPPDPAEARPPKRARRTSGLLHPSRGDVARDSCRLLGDQFVAEPTALIPPSSVSKPLDPAEDELGYPCKMASPSRGYNHDVRYRGRLLHLQSEVSIGRRPQICTQLFVDGTVIATARQPLDEKMTNADVDGVLRTQHKSVLRELCAGAYDRWLSSAVPDSPPTVRRAMPPIERVVRRAGVELRITVGDDVASAFLVTEVRRAGEVVASRRAPIAEDASNSTIVAAMEHELEEMHSKIRRGGLDARLPRYVFVPPPIGR